MFICRLSNWLIARFLKIAPNKDSDFITALILALILTPASSLNDFLVLAIAAAVAMASKYILIINRRHIFNPAAAGAFAAGALLHYYASWWVGTKFLTPVVLIGGLLILRKMKRFTMVAIFLATYLAILSFNIAHHQSAGLVGHTLWLVLISTSVLFFSMIMLTEPLTSPYKIRSYIPYAALVATFYGVTQLHISPENGLLIGNFVGFLLEPTKRLKLSFVERQKEADGIYSFIFNSRDNLKFKPGQYMEWTLPMAKSDSRGNRRYLTISSSPTEKELMLSVRLPAPASSFKQHLDRLKTGDHLLASHLSGSFVLPKDERRKVALLAGGIGITPFRSMVKELLDSGQKRDIALLYSANSPNELAFRELFDSAKAIGLKTTYTITNTADPPTNWQGHTGPIGEDLINDAVPDYKNRLFYISGPYGFVRAAREALLKLGVTGRQIITDYFPGYG
jgi:ferredoxin-NADP reductase